jgi:hypothetical protein
VNIFGDDHFNFPSEAKANVQIGTEFWFRKKQRINSFLFMKVNKYFSLLKFNMMMSVRKPLASELSPYYQTYLKYVEEDDLLAALIKQTEITGKFLSTIPENQASSAYAEGKWLLKEVVGHLCDTERILAYRALRFSRNDKTPLPGFDENEYTLNANYKVRSLSNISDEFKAVRESSLVLFKNMSEEMYDRRGTSNNAAVGVRDLLFFIVAHERHHLHVMRERYLA